MTLKRWAAAVLACGAGGVLAWEAPAGAQTAPSPEPTTTAPTRSDPCGGAQELLKKYLAASPCVFVRGQTSIQSTYSGTNTPVVGLRTVDGQPTAVSEYSHSFGYPNIWINIGLTPNSQVTLVLPTFAQLDDSATHTLVAGSPDVQLRYKNLFYVDLKHGVLGGVLLTYQAPTGSPGLGAPGPSYEINPLLNIALNRSRTTGLSLAFPVTNAATTAPAGGARRAWSFSPQAVPFWRTPGGTLLALVVQYQTTSNTTALTINSAQLLSRNLQLQGTFGASSFGIDYPSATEGIGRTSGTAYSRSFTIGLSYLIGNSEAPPR